MAGVGFSVKVMNTKHSFDDQPPSDRSIYFSILGVLYLADQEVDVMNLSFGGSGRSAIFQEIINYAVLEKNVAIFASSGNDGNISPQYPAAYDNVISVSAIDETNRRASFSNRGVTVDITAPGVDILAVGFDNEYEPVGGTSFSCPVVAGIASLVKSHYPEFTGQQVMEVIRVTANNDIYNISGNINLSLGKGRADAYEALTQTPPAIRADNITVTNLEGNVAQAGDTANVVVEFKNYLWPSTPNLEVNLSTNNDDVTIIQDQVSLGVINTGQVVSNASIPFQMIIKEDIDENSNILLNLLFEDTNYDDYQFYELLVNPTYINLEENFIATTITNNGRIGYQDNEREEGIGFLYDQFNILFEMGLILGSDTNKLANTVRNEIAFEADDDFKQLKNISFNKPGSISSAEITGGFSDSLAGEKALGLSIDYRAMAWDDERWSNFVIIEYDIKNNSENTINNFHLGLFADWDISENGQSDKAGWFDLHKTGIIYSSSESDRIASGIQLLTGEPNYFAIDNDEDIEDNPFGIYDGYSIAEKWRSISGGIQRENAGMSSDEGNDVSHTVAGGPFAINSGESIKIAFALHADNSLEGVQGSAIAADSLYNVIFKVDKPQPFYSSVCYGDSDTIIYDNEKNFQLSWYNEFTGGELIHKGDTLITDNLFNDTTFYISYNDNEGVESLRSAFRIDVVTEPDLTLSGSDNLCEGDTVIITADKATDYLWNTGETTESIIVSEAGEFFVTLENTSLGCVTESDTIVIKKLTAPIADFSISFSGDEPGIKSNITFTDLSQDNVTRNWVYNEDVIGTTEIFDYVFQQPGEISITIEAFSADGCKTSFTQNITLINTSTELFDDQLNIFPNPFSDEINIRSDNNILDIKLFEVSGKEIKVNLSKFDSFFRIKMNNLNEGIYILVIQNSEGNFAYKVRKN